MDITISLSKKDMKQLFRHVYCGHWLLFATKVKREPDADDFYQRFLSIMKNNNIVQEIDYNEKLGMYFVSQDMDDQLHEEAIEEYDEEIFWQELVDRLARRDLETKHGVDTLVAMDREQHMHLLFEAMEKYEQEFEKNGIENIRITK